jgi:glycosyltransferase involved in cell wall biosynthesis
VLCGGEGLDRYPDRRGGTAEALRRADGVIVVSEDLAERVVALGADRRRVRVIYNGINADIFHAGPRDEARARLGLNPDEPIIVFIGALVEVKAVNVLIDSCAKLVGDGVKFRCFLIGHGPLGPSLEEQVERLGLRDTVRFMGPRPHGQLPNWYRAATVFTLPSRSEGVPNVLLEAIACGVPFVASRVGGIPEIAHLGTGRLVPPGDATALAQALAASFDATPSTGRPIRSHAEAANEIAGFFEEVLGQRRSLATAWTAPVRSMLRSGSPQT